MGVLTGVPPQQDTSSPTVPFTCSSTTVPKQKCWSSPSPTTHTSSILRRRTTPPPSSYCPYPPHLPLSPSPIQSSRYPGYQGLEKVPRDRKILRVPGFSPGPEPELRPPAESDKIWSRSRIRSGPSAESDLVQVLSWFRSRS